MKRIYAIIDNNTVTNVVVAETWPDGVEITHAAIRPGPGWWYVAGEFVPPKQAQPVEVTAIERSDLLARMTPVEVTAIERSDLLARMTPVEVHGWLRAATRAQATNSPAVADRNALYAWTRWQALSNTVDLTSADIRGLADVWIALGMTPARAQELLAPLVA